MVKYFKQYTRVWNLIKNKKILFIGDSHIEQGINENLNNSIVNLSQSGDNYLYTYVKLKKIIENNPQIKTIVIGIDIHNIDSSAIDWYTNYNYLNYKFSKLFPYMNNEEIQLMIKLNEINMIKNLSNIISYKNVFQNKISDYGQFKSNYDSLTEFGSELLRNDSESFVSNIQLKYLEKIILFSKSQNKTILLLTMPVFNSEVLKNESYDSLILKTSKKFNVNHINLKTLPLLKNQFADQYHLNHYGSEKTTKVILDSLNINK